MPGDPVPAAPPARVLVIDDDKNHAEATAEALERSGHHCHIATSGREGLERLDAERYDVVVTDLRIYDLDGLEVLKRAKRRDSTVEVIVLTGYGSVRSAVEAIQEGAANYLEKPVNLETLRTLVRSLVDKQELTRANRRLREALDFRFGAQGMIGTSPALRRILDALPQVARSSATVLVTGKSGTGKELVARAIHHLSPRSERPFVALSCAALPEGVLESELFGHEKGAFTGAVARREGKFEYADGGTLFLDEFSEMPLSTQAKLLRVLEERKVVRIGSNVTLPFDVRIVAATNRDVDVAAAEGRIRQDLLFRLRVVHLHLPPLAERREDIPILARAFLAEFAQSHGKGISDFSPELLSVLTREPWPGNVRQLRNVIETMVVLARSNRLEVSDLPAGIAGPADGRPPDLSSLAGVRLQDAEKALIANTLAITEGNRARTAEMLGIGVRTLYRKIKEYGLA